MSEDGLNFNQREAMRRLRALGGWRATYDHSDLNGHTLNSLVKKGFLEKRPRPGRSSITEFRIRTEHL